MLGYGPFEGKVSPGVGALFQQALAATALGPLPVFLTSAVTTTTADAFG